MRYTRSMTTRPQHFVGDPFRELGVASTASRDDVRQAFRRRARETHPDHCPGDAQAAQRFARLRLAYEEALIRLDERVHEEDIRPKGAVESQGRRGRVLTELELVARAKSAEDAATLRRMVTRYGQRSLIGAALAENGYLPIDLLATLRTATENHWTVETAIARRADTPQALLVDIARQARETVTGMAIVTNHRTDGETLDALVQGLVRLDAVLETTLAGRSDLSSGSAARLASRHATNVQAVVRLIERGDLPEELVRRLAGQAARPVVARAALHDLARRGLPAPPARDVQRSPKTLTGLWR